MAYDFSTLSPSDFEDLAGDLMGRALGLRFEVFPAGPDDGMDGRYATATGSVILQAKHFLRSGFSALKSKLTKERAAIDRLQPSRYILVTSTPLTPKNKAALVDVIGPSLKGPGDLYGPDDLNALLRQHPDLERAHPRLWSASTAVLETVVTGAVIKALDKSVEAEAVATHAFKARAQDDVLAKVSSAHLALKFDPVLYVERALEEDIGTWLGIARAKTSTCFLVLAPAGSGKTNLLCRLAQSSASLRPTVLLIGSQLRLDAEHGLWTQVFGACGLPMVAGESRKDRIGRLQAAVARSAHGFAIILDAINEYSDPVALRRELSVFLQDCEQAGLHLLVSCRDYYWGLFDADWWSHFVRSHHDERKSTRRMLGNFSPDETGRALKAYFERYGVSAQPQGNALEQFRHPLLLRFFCETYHGETLGRLRDIRLKDLFDTYWDRKLRSIAERMIDQGVVGVTNELKRSVGQCILDIASHMLTHNVRAISVQSAHQITHSEGLASQLAAPYGRILDEHIVLEELDSYGTADTTLVAFVFEEFMEYAMARAMLARWRGFSLDQISVAVVKITEQYGDFSQVLGVVLYLALMLKEERDMALWPTLIDLGPQWEKVIIAAFRRLPDNQIDDGVFSALIELLHAPHPSIQIEALELLKFGRLRRIPTPALISAVGDLVTSDDLRVRRRALLALGSCPPNFAVPLIEKAITTPIQRQTHANEVTKNAATALVTLNSDETLPVMALLFGGYRRYPHPGQIDTAYLHAHRSAVHALLGSNDMLVRLGAVRMLGQMPSRETLAKLRDIVGTLRAQPPTWTYADLPQWARVAGGPYLMMDVSGDQRQEHYEIESALREVRETEMHVEWNERRALLDRQVNDMIAELSAERLHQAIPTLRCYEIDLVKLLQAGIDRREPDRWAVRKSRRDILITRRGRRGIALSPEEQADLAQLLGLDGLRVGMEGAVVNISTWAHDYDKEYIYRCWGWEPEVLGHLDID